MKILLIVVAAACNAGSLELPLLSPPVRAATPAALQTVPRSRSQRLDATLSPTELHDRFFSGSGPTDLMTVLGAVDQRLAEIDAGGAGAGCLAAAPIETTLAIAGTTLTLPAQCYRRFDAGDFMQFAVVDGTTSIYIAAGAMRMAAIIAPTSAGAYDVDAWYGVGYTNATGCGSTGTFDGCSYGLTALHASSATRSFELSVAGIGEGFCGVQLVSDGTSLFAIGSTDMGTSCNTTATACVSADDLAAPGSCDAIAPTLPALGRKAGAGAHEFGASQYPAAPNVTLDGTDTDSLHFGPVAPSPGVGVL